MTKPTAISSAARRREVVAHLEQLVRERRRHRRHREKERELRRRRPIEPASASPATIVAPERDTPGISASA